MIIQSSYIDWYSSVEKMYVTLTRKNFKRSGMYSWRNWVISSVSRLISDLSYTCSWRSRRTSLASTLWCITQGIAPSQVWLIKIVSMQTNMNAYLIILVLTKNIFFFFEGRLFSCWFINQLKENLKSNKNVFHKLFWKQLICNEFLSTVCALHSQILQSWMRFTMIILKVK